MIRNGFLLLAPVLMAAACATLASCGAAEGDKPGGATMKIESPAFKEGGVIPKKHTGEGADVSPALAWSGAPAGVKEFALICDDPDAPTPQPWVHWVVYAIPADATGFKEGVAKTEKLDAPKGAIQGKTSFGRVGYGGPMPPRGHGVHHYHFKLYALDAPLGLKAGLDKSALLAATQGHVLAEAELIGTYERK